MLSKMLGVVEVFPAAIIKALGASKKIGRDKWLSLRQLLLAPALLRVASEFTETAEFVELVEEKRFDELHDYLKRYKVKSAAKKPKGSASGRDWTSSDSSLNFVMNAKIGRAHV